MIRTAFAVALVLALAGCDQSAGAPSEYEPSPYLKIAPPQWSADAVIYQMNTRQFTAEGTFSAAMDHLPRLADMGVDIVWLMPIHPIGEVERKGPMGSPYAVKDYRAVNPDLGTEEDFRAFVEAAHSNGLKVILDWVANHSAWDNPHTATNPDWYTRNPEGEMMPPEGTDWSDVADFDYSNSELREYMTESLTYWVREFDIDGYRADVAGYVPLDFWETRDLHARAFDATYAWGWKEAMQQLVNDGSGAGAMRGYYAAQKTTWPHAAYRMVYTDNHDQNSWDGVASDIYGPAYEAAIALSFTGPGIPLVYNGQESDLDRQLSFFDKDEITWRAGRYDGLLRRLIALKTEERALWNGEFGAPMIEVPNSASDDVLAFVRGEGAERVFAIFNLSPRTQDVSFELARHHGSFRDAMTGDTVSFANGDTVSLGAWDYRIFQAQN